MNTVKTTILEGPLSELFPKFAQSFSLVPGSPGMYSKSHRIADIISCPKNSVTDWFRKGTIPTGERFAKLGLVMSLCGYEILERNAFDPTVQTFIDTVITVTGVNEAAQQIDVKPENILTWFRGEIKPKSIGNIIAFNEKYNIQREKEILKWKKALEESGFIPSSISEVQPIISPLVKKEEKVIVPTKTKESEDVIIYLLKALQVSLRTDVLVDEEKKKAIRQAIGHWTLAELISNLQKVSLAPVPTNL